jgi:hypothetical protein
MTTTDWDVTTDEGFAAFFAATFDTAYAYAAHLCANDPAGAEALVRLVYRFARGHARDGRVATLSAPAMRSAITNAWRDTQGDPEAPLPATEPSRINSENHPPRDGLYEELFAELVGARINPWAADPDATVAIAAEPERGRDSRRVPWYRVAAYAVLAGVILFVLAITLRDSGTTTPSPTPTSSTTTARTDSTTTTGSTATTSTTPATSTTPSTTPGVTLEP